VYLVTGGLGGIGWTLAEYLARTFQARLVLVGRRAFPDRNEWTRYLETCDPVDPECMKIRAIRALESAGAEVLIVSADVSRAEHVEQAVACARGRYGELHGVIHAAGIAGGGALFLKTREMASQVMAPKVAGTWLLYEGCKNLQPDFFLCCSSLASVVAPAGQYDYCAANAYQDAFCHALDGRTSTRFISINWDAWRTVGMAVDTIVPSHMREQRARELAEGLSCEEGMEVFKRILANPRPQWTLNVRGLFRTGMSEASTRMNVHRTLGASGKADQVAAGSVRGEVARLWTELLGIGTWNDDDDFFTLGGDSLLAVQLRTRLEQYFSRSVSLAALMREPTLAAMTKLIEDSPRGLQGLAS
jgi:NAD(P)-dependent dehydrogenase (short-subunit alcohol dehydrogenase family)/aryl carrier-like protein